MKDKDKAAQSLAVPRLSVCADAQKVDRAKLAQTEVSDDASMRNLCIFERKIREALFLSKTHVIARNCIFPSSASIYLDCIEKL